MIPTNLGFISFGPVTLETILSVFSATATGYFWFVKARRERPSLDFYQTQSLRSSIRKMSGEATQRTLSLTQIGEGGLLIANNSTRQTTILRCDCLFEWKGQVLPGRGGHMEDELYPWSIPPESAIPRRLAVFFDVPDDFELPDSFEFQAEFVTVGGRRFSHTFQLKCPEA